MRYCVIFNSYDDQVALKSMQSLLLLYAFLGRYIYNIIIKSIGDYINV